MSIKENIKCCGTTMIPEGSRIEITTGYKELIGKRGVAKQPTGLYAKSRGYISIDLDEKVIHFKQVNIKASEVKILN